MVTNNEDRKSSCQNHLHVTKMGTAGNDIFVVDFDLFT